MLGVIFHFIKRRMLQLAIFKRKGDAERAAGVESDAQHFAVLEPDVLEDGVVAGHQAEVAAIKITVGKSEFGKVLSAEVAVVEGAVFVFARYRKGDFIEGLPADIDFSVHRVKIQSCREGRRGQKIFCYSCSVLLLLQSFHWHFKCHFGYGCREEKGDDSGITAAGGGDGGAGSGEGRRGHGHGTCCDRGSLPAT
jgi:hypothetical protein